MLNINFMAYLFKIDFGMNRLHLSGWGSDIQDIARRLQIDYIDCCLLFKWHFGILILF